MPLLWETGQQLLHKEFSVDVIAILAIVGSLLLQQALAGALIVLMLSGGEALEAYALRRARSSLSALAERAPRTAHIWQGDELISIPAEQIDVGMGIVVKPGELIPVDGTVTSGSSSTAADAFLLSTDILRVARAVRLGRRVMRVAIEGQIIGNSCS